MYNLKSKIREEDEMLHILRQLYDDTMHIIFVMMEQYNTEELCSLFDKHLGNTNRSIIKEIEQKLTVLHDQIASSGGYIIVLNRQPQNKEGEKYISRQPLVGDKLLIVKYDQWANKEQEVVFSNQRLQVWINYHRDNKEKIPHISLQGVGRDNQSINDRDKNRVTKNGIAMKSYCEGILDQRLIPLDIRPSKIYSVPGITQMDCDYNIGEQFDIAPKNDFEYELQLNRVWNCSYRFNNLPISSLLCTRPLIIITNTTEEYALEGQTKGRNLQREDTYIEDQTLKLLKVKPIEGKYNGGKQKQTLLCGMCIQHHEALYFCTTCKLYICCRCHRFHKEVWIMMKHVIHLVSENTAA